MHYYAFLKAVNIGGRTKLSMRDLCTFIGDKYDIDAKSYLNSGNLIIDSALRKKNLEAAISQSIIEIAKFETTVIIKDRKELIEIYEHDPFNADDLDKSKSVICFVNNTIQNEIADNLRKTKGISERYSWFEDALYIYYHNGIGRSKFTIEYIDRILNAKSTGRNIRTIEMLLSGAS